MALEIYSLALVEVQGLLLTEEADVSVDRDGRSQEQNTVAKQYAGESPGAGIMRIDVTNAVPSVDFELNPGKFFIGPLVEVQIKIFAAGRTLTTKGFIISDNFRHGVNKEATLMFHARCQLVDWI
jgi:hypothetical protein